MKFKTQSLGATELSIVATKEITVRSTDDALDIIGNAPSHHIVIYEENFEQDYFDLSTHKLGDFLQKLTNYRFKVAIIGSFEKYTSKSLRDFIYESNKQGEYLFVSSMKEVHKRWGKLQ